MSTKKPVQYLSGFKEPIKRFIEYKHAAGYNYRTEETALRHFDRMAFARFPKETTLTKEVVWEWLKARKKANLNPHTLRTNGSLIRQFALFLLTEGVPAYVLPDKSLPLSDRYQPHIITKKELKAFFKALDENLLSTPSSPVRGLVAPVVFRLLYSCGLRVHEVRNLTTEDVDLQKGKLFIHNSKNHPLRIVMMHPEMTAVMLEYDKKISRKIPNRKAFFPSPSGERLCQCQISQWFHRAWDSLPEASQQRGNKMRTHDFRHLMALTVIHNWSKKYKNLNDRYELLSAYLGHSRFVYTDYYIHLSEDHYPDLIRHLEEIPGLNVQEKEDE